VKFRDIALLRVVIFVVIAYATAYTIDFSLTFIKEPQLFALAYQLALTARMFAPLLGVIVSLLITGESVIGGLKSYGLKVGRDFLKWFFIALAIPLIMLALGAFYALLIGLPVRNPAELLMGEMGLKEPINPTAFLTLVIFSSLLAGATINTLFAFGEEVGWRGLLLDELSKRMNWAESAMVIGIIWAAWHLPLILLFGYNYPRSRLLGFLLYTVLCMIWSGILVILRRESLSIIHPSVMHGTINSLGGVMLITVPVERVIGIPVGLLSIMASATILAILFLAVKPLKDV